MGTGGLSLFRAFAGRGKVVERAGDGLGILISRWSQGLYARVRRLYMEPIIGIDLGTTNSCLAVMKDGRPVIIENQEGKRTTPSVVAFAGKKVLVGEEAKRQELINGENTIVSSKRLIGRKFGDRNVQEDMKGLGYKVVSHSNGDAWVEAQGKRYSPAQIGAHVLKKMKDAAEAYMGKPVTKAVVTVPAYFTDDQRRETRNAGEIAGLNVLRMINEPTAAALSYGIDPSTDGLVAVYDLGGGTFDVSILEIKKGVFEVKATNGDPHLGGDDFDNEIARYLAGEVKKTSGYDPSNNKAAMQMIKEAAEKGKRALSTEAETEISIPYLAEGSRGPVRLDTMLTRKEMEEIIEPLVGRTVGPCKSALRDAGVSPSEIRHVVMVGGMSRVPRIREVVKGIFGAQPMFGIDPDEAVAAGAAVQGGIISGHVPEVLLIDVAPLSLGIETLGGVFHKIINKNTPIPVKKTEVFTTAEDGQTSVTIKIYEGERLIVSGNKLLGKVILEKIPPEPKGVPKIEVTFEADVNGIYTVAARDMGTSKMREMKVNPSGGLTRDEVDEMVREAEMHRAKDEAQKAFIEEKHRAAGYLKENREAKDRARSRMEEGVRQEVEGKTREIEGLIAREEGSAEEVRAKVKELRKRYGEAYSRWGT
jgi:molecular chaperone DnaK